jgi:hypothetical protein
VIVVDEQGNEYEATYPKRAKGLVKNGRARFVDENTICLASPPDHMEEQNMNANEISAELSYIYAKIDEISAESERLYEVLTNLRGLTEAQEMAAGNMVEAREHTNQRLIALLMSRLEQLSRPEH